MKPEDLKIDLTDGTGGFWEDVVYVPMSPNCIDGIRDTYVRRAMDAKSFAEQGEHREKVMLFFDAHIEWQKRRTAKDASK